MEVLFKMNEQWLQKISFHDFIVNGEYAYFFALNANALYQLRLSDYSLENIGFAPNEKMLNRNLYAAIAENNHKLYLAPMNAEEIAIYDLETKKFKKLALKYQFENMYQKFFGILSTGDKVFLIPARYPYLVVINTKDDTVEYIDSWKRHLSVAISLKDIYCKNAYFLKDDMIYIGSRMENTLIKISINDYASEKITIGKEKEGFMGMCQDKDGEHIWFVKAESNLILKWNENTKMCTRYDNFPKDFQSHGYPFIDIFDDGHMVCAIAFQSNMSVAIDKKTGKISKAKWDIERKDTSMNMWNAKHYFAKEFSSSNFLIGNLDDHSFYLVKNQDLQKVFYLEDFSLKTQLLFNGKPFVRESKKFLLNEYIRYIQSSNQENNVQCDYQNYGEQIHKCIMNIARKEI